MLGNTLGTHLKVKKTYENIMGNFWEHQNLKFWFNWFSFVMSITQKCNEALESPKIGIFGLRIKVTKNKT